MRKAIRLACLFLLSTSLLRAQKSAVISATASVNAAGDQTLLLTLRTPGNIDRISLDIPDLAAKRLRRRVELYITYDPMNPGAPVDFTVAGGQPLVLTFPAKYGAYVKLLIHDGTIRRKLTADQVSVHQTDADAAAAGVVGN